jgi:hypothetical protein
LRHGTSSPGGARIELKGSGLREPGVGVGVAVGVAVGVGVGVSVGVGEGVGVGVPLSGV